ncbi:MAG: DDE-type integrase/transposase/recombinase [Nanoarchaeota archaeon]|nr:DDE-type integrase/transposase/recombinase [Nanoarchaeota archaeon]
MAQKISRVAVWKIKKKYEQWGFDGLKDHQPGRLFEPLSPKFYNLVVEEWKKTKYGARKFHVHFKKKGYKVSLRKISQVMVKEGFQKPCKARQKPRKYKRYEWPISNLMWHTDWHTMKRGSLKGKKILPFIDDCSRKIMAYGVYTYATKNNSIDVLYKAIANNEVIPWQLNSDRGSQFIPNKFDKKGKANHAFQQVLAELGIIFIPSKKRHPQTNGKNEKWFDILEKEFDERFETIDEFIEWYNNERISEAVDYMTPNEAYKKRL